MEVSLFQTEAGLGHL